MLYIFDLDGTLIRSFMRESGEPDDYDMVQVLPGRHARLEDLIAKDRAVSFAIASNQGGIAMGYQTPRQAWDKVTRAWIELGVLTQPLSIHLCFDHPNGRDPKYRKASDFRKPGAGMLLQAMIAHGVGKVDTVFVGDMETDQQAAAAAQVRYEDQQDFFLGFYG